MILTVKRYENAGIIAGERKSFHQGIWQKAV